MNRATLSRSPVHYHHEALFWHGLDDYLERTVPFVTEGLAADMPVMVAVPHVRWSELRRALGSDADRVTYVDMARLGANPACIIPAWRSFVDEHAPDGTPMRGIAEPVWAGRREAEIAECQVHESLLDVAIPGTAPLWLLCPYDADALPASVLAEAERTHPVVRDGHGSAPSPAYVPTQQGDPIARRDLTDPAVSARRLDFGHGDLIAVRRLVRTEARAVRLDGGRTDDLVLAVNEIAANSLDHGGGTGVLHAWREADALVFEVRDSGRFLDPLAGRIDPAPGQVRGRGLWLANRLTDLVQIRQTHDGTVVRLSTWL